MEVQLYETTSEGWWQLERGDVVQFLDSHVTFRYLFPYILLMVCLLLGGFALRHMLVYIEKGLLLLQRLILFLVAFFVVVVMADVCYHALTGWVDVPPLPQPPPMENSSTVDASTVWTVASWADNYTRQWFGDWGINKDL